MFNVENPTGTPKQVVSLYDGSLIVLSADLLSKYYPSENWCLFELQSNEREQDTFIIGVNIMGLPFEANHPGILHNIAYQYAMLNAKQEGYKSKLINGDECYTFLTGGFLTLKMVKEVDGILIDYNKYLDKYKEYEELMK